MSDIQGSNLVNIIKNITFHYIKMQYNDYLNDHNLNLIPEEDIPRVIDELYDNKQKEVKKFIRGTLRKNFQDYDSNFSLKASTEEILLEMFEDSDFAKNRLIIEIKNYQEEK